MYVSYLYKLEKESHICSVYSCDHSVQLKTKLCYEVKGWVMPSVFTQSLYYLILCVFTLH